MSDVPNRLSPWIKGATPHRPVATNINARKMRYFEPWNLGCMVMKMVDVPNSPISQSRKGRRVSVKLKYEIWVEEKQKLCIWKSG